MITGDKVKRTTVAIGLLGAEGYQMPNNEYRMSLSSAAEAVGLAPRNTFDFLQSKAAKRILGESHTDSVSEIEVEPNPEQARGQTRIQAIPLAMVSKYWLRGNKQIFTLVDALLEESLERRFDTASGVERSESERNALFAQRLQQTETELVALGEAYAEPDALREQVAQLEQQLHDAGLEPWQLPQSRR